MTNSIIRIEVEGLRVLGFDLGLSPAAFAQAKLSQLLTTLGTLVGADGSVSPWRPLGVVEREGTMVVWGPDFSGESLDMLLASDRALNALRIWLSSRLALGDAGHTLVPYPAAALIGNDGSVLFPPTALVLRSLASRGPEARRLGAERWVHPDLAGAPAEAFAAASMAYRIFAGTPPFGETVFGSAEAAADSLRADIREGAYLPLRFAAPGIRPDAAELIDRILTPKGKDEPAPDPRALADLLGKQAYGGAGPFMESLPEERAKALTEEGRRYMRKRGAELARRRFLRRNAAAVALTAALALGGALAARSIIASRAERPSTLGLSPLEVAETYYGSFGALNHGMMEACTADKAGAGDVEAVMNLFVISRVREAYERRATVVSAESWLAEGSPEIEAIVFGVTDLELETIGGWESEGKLRVKARYRYWFPPEQGGEETAARPQPRSRMRTDTLTLVLRKGLWRIAELERAEG